MNEENLLTELSELTGLTPGDWADILEATESQQRAILQLYYDAQWVQNKSTFERVLEILGVIGTIAGVVGGVAGAASAVSALRSL